MAYCTQEILDAARRLSEEVDRAESAEVEQSFPHQELRAYFLRNASLIEQTQAQKRPENSVYQRTSQALKQLAAAPDEELSDTEAVEQRLAVLEGKLIAAAIQEASEEAMLSTRREMDRQLAPHRHKMTGEQLARLERQYLERECLQVAGLPRLSLFYFVKREPVTACVCRDRSWESRRPGTVADDVRVAQNHLLSIAQAEKAGPPDPR